jgi:hypothetical protein
MAVYVAGYSLGRFWIEGLRIDPANSGGGWRLNQWVSATTFALSVGYLAVDAWRHRNDEPLIDEPLIDEPLIDESIDEPPLDEPIDEPDSAEIEEVDPDYVAGDE